MRRLSQSMRSVELLCSNGGRCIAFEVSTPSPEKAALIAQMKSNSAKQRKLGSATPVALLAGAALVGAIGYVIWTGRADPDSQK